MSSNVDLTDIRRIETATGSHIEPPLDQSWSQLDKLRWNARVVEVDSGLPLGTFDIRQREHKFAVCYPGMGGMHEFYSDAWMRLNALGEGARLAYRVTPALATRRPTVDEQRASGTRTQPNGPGATEGDE